ncbi:hypothetical protein PHMEG_00027085 [Phytophthora megakarya]|uniref:Elongator complex protein 5 n=1 Tax=Phytophthora megakarya TaxID=4795 RepID=A0A225V9E9_9STRA|nr:hypothetical protein PHMEG_00027085 [Phytophthora megakarya]
MEEFLLHHCVTSDVAKHDCLQTSGSIWQSAARAECVLVQENCQAHGASRVMLSSILDLVLQSAKTTSVLLLTLDSPQVSKAAKASTILTHVDYSTDAPHFHALSSNSQLLSNMLHDIERVEAKVELKGATSARPMVVVLDSLNVLLQQTSLQQVLLFLRRLRSRTVLGSVIARLNAGAVSPEVAEALAAQATALILVETRSSLCSYPLLSKERRRDIPQRMHGLVLLVRQKKNGRSSESIEYFQVHDESITFITTMDVDSHTPAPEPTPTSKSITTKAAPTDEKLSEFKRKSKPEVKASLSHPIHLKSSDQIPLPVRQEEVSFNLSISASEQQAKSQVLLPYMHQGSSAVNTGSSTTGTCNTASAASSNTLFFIDEDDPDWDDDDLDDDLDI